MMEKEQTDITEKRPRKKKNRFLWIIRGDILVDKLSKEASAIIFVSVIIGIFYISNRYSVQQQLLEINSLRIELQDIKYNTLTQKAILLHKSRQSKIETELRKNGSSLKIPTNPPFIIE